MQLALGILLFVFAAGTYVSAVRIGSFNLHQYGPKKSANATLTDLTAQIINDFDLAVIQEITDANLLAPHVLHAALNKVSKSGQYSMSLSPRAGRTASKEQYIFFNRESTSGVELVNAYMYQDLADHFQREPFIGTFKVKQPGSSGVQYFTIMDVHLQPTAAYVELLQMRLVIHDFIDKHPQYFSQTSTSLAEAIAANVIGATDSRKPSLKTNHPILIIGDFNADCTYISATRQNSLRSIDYVDFAWMIENQVKTNTRQTCTYDRIFINGDKFINAIVRGSNTTVNFQNNMHMTLDQALLISDHFPIKFDINW